MIGIYFEMIVNITNLGIISIPAHEISDNISLLDVTKATGSDGVSIFLVKTVETAYWGI